MDDSQRLRLRVATLDNSLDDLEKQLDPLLTQTLPESLVGLDTIQQAKLQVALAYLVYDLIFIYLKTRGIDPKTHQVVTELDRVRQYFDKIKNAEDPEKRTTTVDKAAANRFIKYAIAQVKAQRPPGDNAGPSHIRFDENREPARIPVTMTSKMLARAQYQKELAEAGSEEEEDMEIIDDEPPAGDMEVDAGAMKASNEKGKGKAVDEREAETNTAGQKRRRPAVDPFAGYGDEADESKRAKPTLSEDILMSDATPQDSGRSMPLSSTEAAKKIRKAEKKARKKAKRKESID